MKAFFTKLFGRTAKPVVPALPPPIELTMDERVALASRFYGLYMCPLHLADAHIERNPSKRALMLADLQCAMDNMRIPAYRHQLSDSERAFLARSPSTDVLRA
jgi:hypothetical protein